MAGALNDNTEQPYLVALVRPSDLTGAEMTRCVTIVQEGEAADPGSVETELPLATVLAVLRKREEIVGVGAIKRVRLEYARRIAKRSGHDFPPETSELGYVARVPHHRGHRLAPRIVAALLTRPEGPLWATTDSDSMKAALLDATFEQRGRKWNGGRGELSLWTRG
jgi:hypothetical protein